MSRSCELRGLFPLRFSGGSFPGLSQFPHSHVLTNTCLKSQFGSHANLPFSPCTTLCFLVLCPTYLSHLDLFLFFLESHQSGKTTGRHLRSTFPTPWPGTFKPKIWDWELISFVSQISGITALHFLKLLKLLFCIFCLWFCVLFCFLFVWGQKSVCSFSAPLVQKQKSNSILDSFFTVKLSVTWSPSPLESL